MPGTVLNHRLLTAQVFFCLGWVSIWIVLCDASMLSFTPPGLCAGGATASRLSPSYTHISGPRFQLGFLPDAQRDTRGAQSSLDTLCYFNR